MTRVRWVIVSMVVFVAFGLGAFVGFRRALRRGAPLAPSPADAPPKPEMVGCVDYRQAGAHTGQTGCVSGRILRVYKSRAGNVFLDFCKDYRSCPFTSVIFASDRRKFGDLETLGGRLMEIRGPIGVYQRRAQIIVHDPEHIRAVE